MHPQIVSDEPGICPICQMNLQRVDDAEADAAGESPDTGESREHGSAAARKPNFYRHPMRADVVSSEPATDEMGMAYIPVYEDEASESAGDVPGHAPFTLSMEKQQLIGVTKTRIETRPLEVHIRAVGRVAYDPKLYQAVIEYREAARSKNEIGSGAIREARSGADALLRGARLKLRQQGLSDEQILGLTKGTSDPVELLLPGKSVWIYTQVYEYEAPLVAPGQTMVVTAPSLPGERLTTQVVAVDTILDPMTRTIRVRGLLSTPEKGLRPESFVQVTIKVPLGEKLAVPAEAVLDTGDHQVVFVVDDKGRFEPRSVELGREAQGYYEVLSGLSNGEQVVTSANFLVDSESRFRAALAAYKRPSAASH
jgi:multidrug efflux pump subunit AcrA (membrane-fusion protein)